MSLLAGFIAPHPPIIIPDIGRGEEKKISKTIESYQHIAKKIAELKPSTIIFITPHHLMYHDYFNISPGEKALGTLEEFHSKETFDIEYHHGFLKAFKKLHPEFPAGDSVEMEAALDHGVMVPLHFIQKKYKNFKVVRISLSGLSLRQHRTFGEYISETMEQFNEDYVVVASGDLSHKLKQSGPYGYVKEGPLFDKKITEFMRNGDFESMTSMNSSLYQKAAECGLRSFVILGGILANKHYQSNLHSYEGPFGVGYAVASYIITDPYVWLAKKTITQYLKENKRIKIPNDLPKEMIKNQAGVFVSLKEYGHLRGCIGTIKPTTKCIADEIIQNAISSAFNDPRFEPVRLSELNQLDYSVDVLKEAESIDSIDQLDVLRYGVIVTSGYRSGLLLPNLEGVNTVEEQVNIALSKAGIFKKESYQLYRFEVIRHK